MGARSKEFVSVLLTLLSLSHARTQVELVLEGLHPVPSMIFVAVHNNAQSFNGQAGEPLKKLKVPHESGTRATIPIPDLKAGTYAFLVFQDENGNKLLDRNLLGIPTEPYGFSGSKGMMLGPPDFEKAKVKVEPGRGAPARVLITMR
ncbi:MAG: DUF2141 domain-containing protein [Flavobacteriales bacterium]|nr:DUF2141 domain-containing protein [Flavobacteriales bacterium]MDW8410570.1 DUF2141 domain-containing protein [Flavobacteriales bacterium]